MGFMKYILALAFAGILASLGWALFFMLKDGLDANTPIYYSLSVALVSFVLVSVLAPRPSVVTKAV